MYLKFGKRFLDIISSILFLTVGAPFFVLAGLIIWIDTGWPILVRLERVSGGRNVRLFKFRSMVRGAAALKKDLAHLNERKNGPFFKIKNDPRVTRSGRWLRKIRFDEFPQLLNVLTGDISLIGPRPHEPEEVAQYPEQYQKLPLAKAGLTGLSQVNGASALSASKELELDSYYLKYESFSLDLRILLKTFRIFFSDPTGV
ncbi:MAG: sugar transferase [bacterium]|nr:sugar transferase [bacterium]